MPKSMTLAVAVGVDHHVLRLDVAVDDAAAVREVERREQLHADEDRLVAAQAAAAADEVLERLALHVLHDDVVRAVDLAPVVDADEVLLVEAGRGLGLAAEALDEGGVVQVPLQQHLDGDVAAEREVLAQIHVGHAAAADLAHHAVPAADHLFWLEHVTHVWSTSLVLRSSGTTTGARSLPSGQGGLRQGRLHHGCGERRRRLAAGRLCVLDRRRRCTPAGPPPARSR